MPNTIAEGELLINGLEVNRNKTEVIHNGVEERFAEADPTIFQKRYGLKDFILYVGHLGPYRKNGLNMLKAKPMKNGLRYLEVLRLIASLFTLAPCLTALKLS